MSSTTGLPFLAPGKGNVQCTYFRRLPEDIAPFVVGRIELPWKARARDVEGKVVVRLSLGTRDERIAP